MQLLSLPHRVRHLCVLLLLFQAVALLWAPRPAFADRQRELRGVWVTRFQWKSAADVAEIVANVKAMGGNAIFFQVRGEADAFYRSRYEPWSARLTGTLGRDPGWDPLQTMIDRAHAAGLEVHAWLNTYSAWSGTAPPSMSSPEHVLNAHPDWVAVDVAGNPRPPGAEYTALSPGNPAVQQHIVDVVGDIASRYDVDGIHLDYVRYSGRDFSYDTVSNRRLASPADNPSGLSRADWQRAQVTELVRRVYAAVKGARPRAQLSAAVWGIYRNVWNWPLKNTGYDAYYQDSREWLRRGLVDFVVPMVYYKTGGMPDYNATVRDLLGTTYGRGVYPGLGVYQSWATWEMVNDQIDFARKQGANGVVLFSYPNALSIKARLAAGPWAGSAVTPWSAVASPTPVPPTATPVPPTAIPASPTPAPTRTVATAAPSGTATTPTPSRALAAQTSVTATPMPASASPGNPPPTTVPASPAAGETPAPAPAGEVAPTYDPTPLPSTVAGDDRVLGESATTANSSPLILFLLAAAIAAALGGLTLRFRERLRLLAGRALLANSQRTTAEPGTAHPQAGDEPGYLEVAHQGQNKQQLGGNER